MRKKGENIGNRYELIRRVGRGGQGDVWKARDWHDEGNLVALKFLHPEFTNQPELVGRFASEAIALRSIHSDYVVRVRELVLSMEGMSYLALEYLGGQNLDEEIEACGPFAPSRAVETVIQVCRGLSAIHDKRMMHRDLKPQNVRLIKLADESERVKLFDFGVAKLANISFTRPGGTVGSDTFMAPEQIPEHGEILGYSHRVDIYSAGALLYTLLTSEPPCQPPLAPIHGTQRREWEHFFNMLRLCKEAPPEFPSELGISGGLQQAVAKAMAFDSEDRYASADSFAEALVDFIEPPPTRVFIGAEQSETPLLESGADEEAPTGVFDEASRANALSALVPQSLPPAQASSLLETREDQPRLPVSSEQGVVIAPGEFEMGSPSSEPGRWDDETLHMVVLANPLLVQPKGVTQDEFVEVMGYNPAHFKGGDRPVEQVSWFEVVAFCNRLSTRAGLEQAYVLSEERGKPGDDEYWADVEWRGLDSPGWRLPTEAEWEHFCRAGTKTATYQGDLESGKLKWEQPNTVLDHIGWFGGNSWDTTHDVGLKAQNSWGVFDTLGNVWEWVWDWYGEYPAGVVPDPCGSRRGPGRVIRGGCFSNYARSCRAATRSWAVAGHHYPDTGFRIVRSLG